MTYLGLVVSSGSLSVDLVRLIVVYFGNESLSEVSSATSPKSLYLVLSNVLYVGLNLSVDVSIFGVSSSSSSLVISTTSLGGLEFHRRESIDFNLYERQTQYIKKKQQIQTFGVLL